ncbi:hypothetical protein JMJ77_0011155, partial [Colletotrichum scovillei]
MRLLLAVWPCILPTLPYLIGVSTGQVTQYCQPCGETWPGETRINIDILAGLCIWG